MKQFIFLCLLSVCSLFATAQIVKPWAGGRLMVSANHRFLQTEDGKPFFWLGETAWLMPEHLDRSEVTFYLTRCREAGYNMVQVQVLNDLPTYNIYGQMSNPYGWDLTKADPEGVYSYWDHLDYIVHEAERQGIYVGLVPIWGTLVKQGALNEQQAVTYGTFLANRYKNCPNIIWIIGGDIQGDIHPEVWNALATTIKGIDNNHLMTYHPRGRYTSARWWSKAPWLDFHTFQSGHRRYGQRMNDKTYPIPDSTEEDNWMYVDSTWAYQPIKPVLDDEPVYENIPKGLHDPNEPRWQACDVRRYAYWSVFAGSCGHTYGNNSIMQMLKPGYVTGYGVNGKEKTWVEALNDPGFNEMRYLKDLMLSFPYFERVPDQSIVLNNGKRYDRMAATRGKSYLLVYNYSAKPMTIDLRKITGKQKKLWWMNPKDGSRRFLGTFPSKVVTIAPDVEPKDGQIEDRVLIAVDDTVGAVGLVRRGALTPGWQF